DDHVLAGARDVATAIRSDTDAEPFERGPLGAVTTEPAPGHTSTMFSCQRPGCDRSAGWVAVIARDTPHPDDAVLHRDVLEGPEHAGQVLFGGFLDVNQSQPVGPDAFARVRAALRDGDVLALWEESDEFVPFYCVRCRAAYCAADSALEEV